MKQGGTRRGANMGILRVDHPDIMEFITCKEDLTQVTNFNISVARDAEVHGGGEGGHELRPHRSGHAARSSAQLDARTVWDKMILGAWRTGEPGVLLRRRSEPLQPGPAPRHVRGDEPVRRAAAAPVRRLQSRLASTSATTCTTARWTGTRSARDIHLSTHFLDNIIDVNKYPLAGDRHALQAHPPHRPRHHGLRRRARPPRHRLRHATRAWSSAAR